MPSVGRPWPSDDDDDVDGDDDSVGDDDESGPGWPEGDVSGQTR